MISETAQKDLRETPLFHEVEAFFRTIRRPGTGAISDAIDVSTEGTHVAFSGFIVDTLEGAPPTRICLTDLATGGTRVLTFGPNIDKLPKFSPDGKVIAFLSDRQKAGDFQLYLLDPVTGIAEPTEHVNGWVEYFHWSSDGKRILLGVAGYGADLAAGGVRSKEVAEELPSWVPAVTTGDESYRWRTAWIYDLATRSARQVTREGINIWEAVWCGNDALTAVVSPRPEEGWWFSNTLHIIDIATGNSREIYAAPDQNQLGWPGANPSGSTIAIVEAICSDRGFVAGDIRLIETASGKVRKIDTHGIDITFTNWRSEDRLLLAGCRGFATVVACYDAKANVLTEVWSSEELACTSYSRIIVSGLNEVGDFVIAAEGFRRAPEIGIVRAGKYRTVKSFDLSDSSGMNVVHTIEKICWKASDGLEIQGWLLLPKGSGPHPLVMNVHGGPVGNWKPIWLGRSWQVFVLELLKRGYAVFYPNPRGSSGRGQHFARQVLGEMGGADTYDYLSGIDWLVEQGIADPRRLGVTGISYGGYMTSWLVTQDTRFAAAVSSSPVTNQVTQHLISKIPQFVSLFLADTYTNPGGKYFQRSPIMHAHKVTTPTLHTCGLLDNCTPPEEALQFHNALLENGVTSVLVTYPEEGHGIAKWPSAIDYTVRLVSWFEKYMADQ